MRKILLSVVLFLSLLYFLPASALSPIVLGLGETQTIPLRGATHVWIEDKLIASAMAEGNHLLLKGLASGETLLRLNGQTQKIQVIHPAQMDSYKNLQLSLRNRIGLEVEISKGNIAVVGKLYSLSDWKILARKKFSYQMRAELPEALQQEAQHHFNLLMKKEHLPRLNLIFSDAAEVRLQPQSIYLDKYRALFSAYGIKVMEDPSILATAPTIKVQITVAEVKRKFQLTYGVEWPQTQSATLSGSTTKFSDFEWIAHGFEEQGFGKILASPNIICRSGKEAEFLAGGEIPLKVRTHKTYDVVWKKYGVFLKVKPLADSSGRMSISIETEVSTLDGANKVDEVPGILTNRVSSHFDLTKPQTIALSGLIKNENSEGRAGLPMLSRLPIIGALFSSKDFQERQSELVIFVRPTILDEEDPHIDRPAHIGSSPWK